MSEKRYRVFWVPSAEVVKACEDAGMQDDDDTTYDEWVSPIAHSQEAICDSFDEAIDVARQKLDEDFHGVTSVHREWLDGETWERDAVWQIHENSDDISEDRPTFRSLEPESSHLASERRAA